MFTTEVITRKDAALKTVEIKVKKPEKPEMSASILLLIAGVREVFLGSFGTIDFRIKKRDRIGFFYYHVL